MGLLNKKNIVDAKKSFRNQYRPQTKTLIINQEQLKLRLNSLCYLDIWWKQKGLDGLSESCPSQVILSRRTSCSACLSLSSGFQFSASWWNHSNKPIASPAGSRGHLTLLLLQRLPPTASGGSVITNATPVWFVVSSAPELWGYVNNKLSNSPVPCQVLCLATPRTLRWKSLPHQWSKGKVIKTRIYHLNKAGKIKKQQKPIRLTKEKDWWYTIWVRL